MHNLKKSMRLTIAAWVLILVFGLLTVAAVNANAGDSKAAVNEREAAVVILWYTADGKPHNIFIVDYTHVRVVNENMIVIDRTPTAGNDGIPDQVLMGGMFDLQSFKWDTVFHKSSRKLKDKFNKFAVGFKNTASEHLVPRKADKK